MRGESEREGEGEGEADEVGEGRCGERSGLRLKLKRFHYCTLQSMDGWNSPKNGRSATRPGASFSTPYHTVVCSGTNLGLGGFDHVTMTACLPACLSRLFQHNRLFFLFLVYIPCLTSLVLPSSVWS